MMNSNTKDFLSEHQQLTRRYFLRCGTVGAAAIGALPLLSRADDRDELLHLRLPCYGRVSRGSVEGCKPLAKIGTLLQMTSPALNLNSVIFG